MESARTQRIPLSRFRRARTDLLVISTVLAAICVWFARRPGQLLAPYIWVEEKNFLETLQCCGFLDAAMSPVNGQLILSSSITATTLQWYMLPSYP